MKFDEQRKYEWLIFPQSFFQNALITSRILREQLNKFGASKKYEDIYGDYPQSPEYLVFPIMFSLKHGIELYLKSIAGTKAGEFAFKHNLMDLLNRAGIEDEKLKSAIKKDAYSLLLLADNEENDEENQFERYPQGFPYDTIDLFSTNPENNIVSFEKVNELIEDIEYLASEFRKITNKKF